MLQEKTANIFIDLDISGIIETVEVSTSNLKISWTEQLVETWIFLEMYKKFILIFLARLCLNDKKITTVWKAWSFGLSSINFWKSRFNFWNNFFDGWDKVCYSQRIEL